MSRTEYKSIPKFGMFGPTRQMKHGIDVSKLGSGDGFEMEFCTDEMSTHFNNSLLEDKYFDSPDMVKCSTVFEDLAVESEDDDDDSISTFDKLRRKMQDVVDGGYVKKIIVGEGVGEVVPAGARARVHYHAFLEDMDEPYDSSYLQGRQLHITLGRGDVIPGLDLAIATMRKGEKTRFLIEPSYGYGAIGCPPRIPPNSPILFEVELLGFSENLNDFNDEEARNGFSLERALTIAKSVKEEGNELFSQGNYYKAQKKFLRCINVLEAVRLKDEEEEIEMVKTVGKAYQNMGLCSLKLGNFGKALDAARRVLEYDPDNAKALFIAGKSLRHIGDFSYARKYLLRARRIVPSSGDVAKELKLVERSEEKFRKAEVDMCKKIFSGRSSRSLCSAGTKPVREKKCDIRVSASFQDIVSRKLNEFAETSDDELSIPVATFTQPEIYFAANLADELGLDAELVEKPGKPKHLKITKNVQ